MRIRALLQNKVMLVLVDSGSSHSFISTSFLQTTGIKASKCAPAHVQVANGENLVSDQVVPQMEW